VFRDYRAEGPNPARWRGNLDQQLGKRSKIKPVKHHAALPYESIGGFMTALRQQEGVAPRALEFIILTAARTGEALGATWAEIDLAENVWTVPASRMKAKREHRVPLSPAAVKLLEAMKPLREKGDFVFPGGSEGEALSNMACLKVLERMARDELTVHGMRSTFRDWASECTSYPHEVCEMALAHVIPNKAEAAYRRRDLFEKRRHLMTDWAKRCAKADSATVTEIRARKAA
jgi:integrase